MSATIEPALQFSLSQQLMDLFPSGASAIQGVFETGHLLALVTLVSVIGFLAHSYFTKGRVSSSDGIVPKGSDTQGGTKKSTAWHYRDGNRVWRPVKVDESTLQTTINQLSFQHAERIRLLMVGEKVALNDTAAPLAVTGVVECSPSVALP